MGNKVRITENLDIDLEKEMWCCRRCGYELISAREDYRKGCLVYDRDPTEIYPMTAPYFSPDPEWVRFVEFYCPNCGQMIVVDQLPPGHPIIPDIELDIDLLKSKYLKR